MLHISQLLDEINTRLEPGPIRRLLEKNNLGRYDRGQEALDLLCLLRDEFNEYCTDPDREIEKRGYDECAMTSAWLMRQYQSAHKTDLMHRSGYVHRLRIAQAFRAESLINEFCRRRLSPR